MDAASRNPSFSSLYESYADHAETKPINLTGQQMYRHKSSEVHNAHMRQIMVPWGSISSTPPGCRAVSFSSWRRFSAASTSSKSSEEMKASVILEEHGTTPEYDPPVLEICNLRIAEDAVCENPEAQMSMLPQDRQQRFHPRIQRTQLTRNSSTSSWTTITSASDTSPVASKSISFKKQMVRPASTSSLLTAGFNESPKKKFLEPPKAALEKIGKEFGIKGLTIDNLPEDAFESDSEDED